MASDAGESFAANVSQFQENESFEENLSGGSSTFLAGRSGAGFGTDSRTVTCDGPDASGWFGCIAYTSRGLTITRQVRFWSGGSYALGWSPTLTDSVNHRWSRTGTFESAVKPGKMFSINEADTASMVVTHGHAGASHVERRGGRARQQHVHGEQRDAHLRVHRGRHGRGAHLHPAAQRESISDLWLDLAQSHAAHHSGRLRQDDHAHARSPSMARRRLQVGALTCSLDLATGVVSGAHRIVAVRSRILEKTTD